MFALNATSSRKARIAFAARDGENGRVLPRFLRRPARFFAKVFDGEIVIPRFVEPVGLVGIFAATALYGSVVSGQFGGAAERVTAALGFAVNEVEVSGHRNTSEVAVFEALGLDEFTSLISLDAAEARKALESLPWVETATVRKVYPGKLEIGLEERRAFAIWQTGETLSLIERDGRVIGAYGGAGFASLPLVVGPGAATAAAPFMEMLSRYPRFASQVKALIHVGERRWDVRLANGITVKLPAEAPEKAVERLMAMDEQTQILSRDIASVDLRLEDRTTVALTENAMLRRAAALEARAKAIKASKRSSI
ncbi:cell division protein FtsQ/DivIB [Oricola thermophila]|uniref:Cell division protein FtsQ n=1 Tax=Oricola thermophila TaxID=2742145 RepID=A0A6N1V909_9HYPH|nr:cell division protein FtsQ/DivIB [Oricola thermophila]QKV17208.1 cell division protein FtsQ/DivIB [Oricola thermophila]